MISSLKRVDQMQPRTGNQRGQALDAAVNVPFAFLTDY